MLVGLLRQIEALGRAGGVLVADPVEAALQAVDAGGVSVGVLIAVVAVVPIQNVEAPVGAGLLHDGHEPRIVRRQEIGFAEALVGRAIPLDPIDVDAAAVDVAHVELAPVLLGIGVAVEVVDAAVGRLLMLVLDDAFDLPRERRIRTALTVVVAGLDQMPQMVDHARADERFPLVVEGDPPRVARPLAEDLELARTRMDAEHRAGEFELGRGLRGEG